MDNMTIYSKLAKTPKEAQKTIGAGRLKGFTEINPMWRIKMLTDTFGVCGFGWYVEETAREIIPGAGDECKAFVRLNLFIKMNGEWSMPIVGEGGSSFISSEKNGLYTDDEAYKKAYTDALGSCCKMLGMSSDIYFVNDRTKYTQTVSPEKQRSNADLIAELVSLTTPEQQKALEKQKDKPFEDWSATELQATITKINERNRNA